MKIKFLLVLALFPALLAGSGCTYFMLWKTASYDYDDTLADQYINDTEVEREARMQGNQNYRDAEIKAVNEATGNTRANTAKKPLTVEELRAQQERERKERENRKKK